MNQRMIKKEKKDMAMLNEKFASAGMHSVLFYYLVSTYSLLVFMMTRRSSHRIATLLLFHHFKNYYYNTTSRVFLNKVIRYVKSWKGYSMYLYVCFYSCVLVMCVWETREAYLAAVRSPAGTRDHTSLSPRCSR